MSVDRVITKEELYEHRTAESAWIAIDGNVYDVTAWLDEHPGGEDVLLEVAGHDASKEFGEIGHSDAAKGQLAKFKIGTLVAGEDEGADNSNDVMANIGAWAAAMPKVPVDPQVREMFDLFDTDRSGFIDRGEFRVLAHSLGVTLEDAELDAAIASIDLNNDGNISYAEFATWYASPTRSAGSAQGDALRELTLRLTSARYAAQAQRMFRQASDVTRDLLVPIQGEQDLIHASYIIQVGELSPDMEHQGVVKLVNDEAAAQALMDRVGVADTPEAQQWVLVVSFIVKDDALPNKVEELQSLLEDAAELVDALSPPEVSIQVEVRVRDDAETGKRLLEIVTSAKQPPGTDDAQLQMILGNLHAVEVNVVGVPKDQDPNQLGGGRAEFRVEMTKAAAEMAAAAAPPVPFARWAKLFRAVELEFDFGSVQELLEEMDLPPELEARTNAMFTPEMWEELTKALIPMVDFVLVEAEDEGPMTMAKRAYNLSLEVLDDVNAVEARVLFFHFLWQFPGTLHLFSVLPTEERVRQFRQEMMMMEVH